MKQLLYIGNNFTEKSKYNSTLTTLSNLLKTEGFNVVISSNKKNKLLRLFAMCWSVIKFRNKIDYILIDTFSTSSFYFAYCTSRLARLFKVPYIPILHGGNLPYRLQKSTKISNKIFKNSYANVAPSNYLKSAFEKEGYKTIYIPNTIKIKDYQFKERTVFNPNILWVRAFDKIYNPQMTIEVLNELKKNFSIAKLCMVGPQKDDSLRFTQQLISELNLSNCVTITGVLSKEKWHKLSVDYDVFINTTTIDNTPLSVIEAMALGLPIVSTNVGGLPFLIDANKDGILVDNKNVNQMTEAITNIINKPKETIEMIANARKKVESFDWDTVRNKWLTLLK